MRLLLVWLGTKSGCSIFTSSIKRDKPHAVHEPERFFLSWDIYPFQESVRLANERELFKTANTFLDESFEPRMELAGALHEHMTSQEFEVELTKSDGEQQAHLHIRNATDGKYGRRKKGQFYTPPWVVDYCLEKSLSPDLNRLMKALQQRKDIPNERAPGGDFRIIDPSCGTGNFLLGILRFLNQRGASANELIYAATNSIYGRDLDGKAVSIAIWSVLLFLYKTAHRDDFPLPVESILSKLSKNIRVTDAVLDSFALRCSQESSSQDNNSIEKVSDERISEEQTSGERISSQDFNQREDESGFDLVITNPPYISFGSRNQERILDSTASFLRYFFSASAEYKIRLNSIFQEVALNYAKDGAKICLFIPNSFLTGKGYAKLRKALLKRTRILSFTELREDTMKNAVVGRWCVAVYQKREHALAVASGSLERGQPQPPAVSGIDNQLNYPVELVTFSKQNKMDRYEIQASHLVTNDHSRFRLVFGKLDEDLALKMEQLPMLSSVARGHTGIRARNGQKSILAENRETNQFKKGIRSGGRVKPFSVAWDGTWMKIDPKLLFSGGFDERVVENPKLMVRQTGDRIVAAYDETGLYHLNNVHSFSCQLSTSQSKIDLHLLLALMNSNLWHYLYRMKTREDGRALAQIDIETVETMPLPTCEDSLSMSIANLCKKLCRASSENTSHEEIENVNAEINQLIYAAYKLSHKEVDHVESSLGLRYNSPLLKTGAG